MLRAQLLLFLYVNGSEGLLSEKDAESGGPLEWLPCIGTGEGLRPASADSNSVVGCLVEPQTSPGLVPSPS